MKHLEFFINKLNAGFESIYLNLKNKTVERNTCGCVDNIESEFIRMIKLINIFLLAHGIDNDKWWEDNLWVLGDFGIGIGIRKKPTYDEMFINANKYFNEFLETLGVRD